MKKLILFGLVLISLSAFLPQVKWNSTNVWNLKANNTIAASGKYSNGATYIGGARDTSVGVDTTNALFVVDNLSDLTISDSFYRTAAILSGTAKLYGTDDTSGGINQKWYQVIPDTATTSGVVGLGGYTATNTASQKAVWTIPRFRWHYGRVQYIGATGSVYQVLKVYGKY